VKVGMSGHGLADVISIHSFVVSIHMFFLVTNWPHSLS